MDEMILHVGAHKTGTTLIQRALEEGTDRLAEHGIGFISTRDPKLVSIGITAVNRVLPFCEPTAETLATIRDGFRYFQEQPWRTVLISNEGLLGFAFHRGLAVERPRRGLYADARTALGFIRPAIEVPVRVVLYIRAQAGMVESVFNQMSVNRVGAFEEWLERIGVDRLSWMPLVDAICDVFGEDHLMLKTMQLDESGPGPAAHIAEFVSDVLGIEWEVASNIPPSNPSLSDLGIAIMGRVNDLSMSPPDRRAVIGWLKRRFSILDGPRPAFLDAAQRAEIDAMYRDENAALLARFGTPSEEGRQVV